MALDKNDQESLSIMSTLRVHDRQRIPNCLRVDYLTLLTQSMTVNLDCKPHYEALSRFQCYSKITKRRKVDGPNEFLSFFLWKMVNTFRIEMWLIAYLNLIHSQSKLILSRSKVYDSLYYFLIFYSIKSGTSIV